MSEHRSEVDHTLGRRYYRTAAAVCLALSVAWLVTFAIALFDPPQWNRAERLLEAWAWFYVGYLHWRLSQLTTPPAQPDGEASA